MTTTTTKDISLCYCDVMVECELHFCETIVQFVITIVTLEVYITTGGPLAGILFEIPRIV